MRLLFASLLFCAAAMTGCSAIAPSLPPLPAYEWVDERVALEELAQRAERIETVMARCDVKVDSDTVHSTVVQGALVADCPDHLRVRLWKFTHTILDLTVRPDGVWLLVADQKDAQSSGLANPHGIERVSRFNQFLSSDYFRDPNLDVVYGEKVMSLVRRTPGKGAIHCTVDLETLTPKEYRFEEADGTIGAHLKLTRYQVMGDDIYWPHRWQWQFGKVKLDVHFRELDLNTELPTGAFIPSKRAQKRS